jgi:hypothetical protein
MGSTPIRVTKNISQVSQCSAGFHKPSSPGATPGPATAVEYANWQSDQFEKLVTLWVRLPPRLLTRDPVVQRQRRLVDIQEIDGSIPSGIIAATMNDEF